jgi:hypothetical protein
MQHLHPHKAVRLNQGGVSPRSATRPDLMIE